MVGSTENSMNFSSPPTQPKSHFAPESHKNLPRTQIAHSPLSAITGATMKSALGMSTQHPVGVQHVSTPDREKESFFGCQKRQTGSMCGARPYLVHDEDRASGMRLECREKGGEDSWEVRCCGSSTCLSFSGRLIRLFSPRLEAVTKPAVSVATATAPTSEELVEHLVDIHIRSPAP